VAVTFGVVSVMNQQVTRPTDAVRCQDCGSELVSEPGMPRLCPQCLLSLALRESPGPAHGGAAQDALGTLDRLAGGRVLGERYQIRELLGRGGMGEVFRAFDLKLRVEVALKAVRPEQVESERARELLRREVRSAREVVSPNVCRIFDLVAEDGQELVSMEYVDGVTLGETLRRRGPLALEEAREIALQFLAGLEAIHQAGLVHRDFKPENVMVTRAGRVVVMDFGLAKLLASGRAESIAGTPAYMPPEQMRGDAVDARTDVFAAGVVLAEMLAVGGAAHAEERQALWRAVREAPPRVPAGPWASVLSRALSPDPQDRPRSARELSRALEEVTQRLPGFETRRPYPGLASFTEEDAEYFFGRELEVEAFLKKLRRPRLLALVAPSGSGKSSFLRAGLLPALPKGWKALFTTPGSRPFEALARTLVPVFAGDTQATEALLRFEEAATALGLVQRFRQRHEQALVIVDQFEELFTLNPPEVQRRFAELLARLVLEADLHVILSLRDDFLFRCRDHEPLQPAFSQLTPLGRLDQGALRRALVQPALACGYLFEDEALVDEMIAEVQRERGALPLIAFAAARLWEKRDRERGQLTRAAYQEIGGVAGSLAQHAEATLERIGSQRLPIVRELLRNLVTAEGTRAVRERAELLSVFAGVAEDAPATRHRVQGANDSVRAESGASRPKQVGSRTEAESTLDVLLDARLLTSYERPGEHGDSRNQVEIVHESLLEAWPRLVRWRTQDEDGAQLRDQLRQAAQLWNDKGRSGDLLWTGTAYEEFRLWRERYPGSLSAVESDYARAMVDRARRRKRLVRLAVAAAFVAISAVAVVVGISRRQALRALDHAEASRLLAIGEARLSDDPTEALAFATASLARADSEQARMFALRALSEAPPAIELIAPEQNTRWPAFSPDGERLAAGGFAADALVWSADGRGPLVLPGHETSPRGGIWPQWASNDMLVTGFAGSANVHLWSMPEGRRVRTIDFGRPSSWQVGSRRLLAETPTDAGAPGGGLLRSWTLPDGEAVVLGRDVPAKGASWTALAPDASRWFHARGRDIHSLPLPIGSGPERLFLRLDADLVGADVRHDPDRLVLADKTGQTLVLSLDAERPSVERTILRPETAPPGMVLDRSGRWLASQPSSDRLFRLWDLTQCSAARPLTLRRNLSWYASQAAFDPVGDWIAASTGRVSRLTLWPLQRPRPIVVEGYVTGSRGVAFSPDGRWLVTTWADRRLRLWPLTNGGMRDARLVDPSVPPQGWGPIAFDPRGRLLFAVGGGQPWIFPLDGSAARLTECSVGESVFASAAFSPSGRRVATATYYGAGRRKLCTWDLETSEARNYDLPPSEGHVGSLTGYERGVFNLAFADEQTVFIAGDGGLRRWDVETGAQEVIARAAPGHVFMGSFSANARVALMAEVRMGQRQDCREARLYDLANGSSRPVTGFGPCGSWQAVVLDAAGAVVATAGRDGIVRVGRLGAEPHLLLGHKRAVDRLRISPDLRWIATTGEDDTLRLWPMPDLSQRPLHTLPYAELLAKLRSLTNIRVVPDASTTEGFRLEVGPFPGWRTVPEW
jgi:WD40 repeat protein/tRNA A-37 threonylcarbamoyl transferase component Bud32